MGLPPTYTSPFAAALLTVTDAWSLHILSLPPVLGGWSCATMADRACGKPPTRGLSLPYLTSQAATNAAESCIQTKPWHTDSRDE